MDLRIFLAEWSLGLQVLQFIYIYIYIYIYIKKTTFYLFIFRERGREGEREGEKRQCVVASHVAPTGDLTRNPGMCPDWESNQWPFGSEAGAQSTEPHQPGHSLDIFILYWNEY